MKVIIGESPVTFRRKTYAPGDKVDLPDNIAKNLISAGTCEIPGNVKKEKVEIRKEGKEMKNANKKMSNSG